jgi:hypothetical protein
MYSIESTMPCAPGSAKSIEHPQRANGPHTHRRILPYYRTECWRKTVQFCTLFQENFKTFWDLGRQYRLG